MAFPTDKPIFVDLADKLRDDILAGVYAEESAVPSTNELAVFYRINPATAGKAVNLLVDQEILYKRRGIGMFVAPGARERLLATRRDAFAADYIRPMLAEAHALGLTQDAIIDLIRKETP